MPTPEPNWRPAPQPQHELDRLIPKAAVDPSYTGQMFRLLMESNLFILVPYHPELEGDHERDVADGFTWITFQDANGAFVPVFTSYVCAQHESHQNLKSILHDKPMIAELPANVLLHFLNNGRASVRVMAAGGGTIKLKPDAVASLVAGELTRQEFPTQQVTGDPVNLRVLEETSIPSKVLQGIRMFCAKRRVPLGVYAFNQMDPATGEYPGGDLRIILWLRTPDRNFYNDFCLMVGKLVPDRLEFFCTAVTPEQESIVTFLQGKRPIWPIMPKNKKPTAI